MGLQEAPNRVKIGSNRVILDPILRTLYPGPIGLYWAFWPK